MPDALGSLTSPNDPKFKKSFRDFKKNSLIKSLWKSNKANKPFGGMVQNVINKVKGNIK
jgi:hypothetical protein